MSLAAWALAALVIVCQPGDWLTSRRVISQGGREINTAMAWLIRVAGFDLAFALKGLIMAALVILIAIYVDAFPAALANGLTAVLYLYVVWHNWRLIR